MKFADEREKELFAAASMGEDVRTFLVSRIGKYLNERAVTDREKAKEDLLSCNPWTPWGRRRIIKLQQQAEMADNFMRYCLDAIQDGEVAYQELQERENK